MANSYFNYSNPVQPGDRVESNKYNGDFGAIARAFDTLPSPEDLATNTRNYATSTGTGTAYQVNIPSFDPSFGYIEGMQVLMRAHVTNTGSATISITGGPAVVLRNRLTGSSGNGYALVAGDIAQGAIYSIRFDGTEFQVVNTVANALISSQTAAASATAAAANALAAQQAAAASASAAAASAGNAAGSASAATTQAGNAAASASAAAGSAGTATTQAGNAAASATAAAGSAGTAGTQASSAAASATAAAGSATTATTQASNAAGSATTATAQASNAAASAAAAQAVLTDAAFKNAVLAVLLEPTTGSLRVGIVKLYAANVSPNTLYPGTTWVRLPADYALRTAASDGSGVLTTSGIDAVSLTSANMPLHSHGGTVAIQNFTYGAVNTSSHDFLPVTSSDYDFGTVNVNSYSFGTLNTSQSAAANVASSFAGAHTHSFAVTNIGTGTTGTIMGQASPAVASQYTTSNNGEHQHTVQFPAHLHNLTLPAHAHSINLGLHNHTVVIPSHAHTVTFAQHAHTVTVTLNNTGGGQQFSVKNKSVRLVAWRRTA